MVDFIAIINELDNLEVRNRFYPYHEEIERLCGKPVYEERKMLQRYLLLLSVGQPSAIEAELINPGVPLMDYHNELLRILRLNNILVNIENGSASGASLSNFGFNSPLNTIYPPNDMRISIESTSPLHFPTSTSRTNHLPLDYYAPTSEETFARRYDGTPMMDFPPLYLYGSPIMNTMNGGLSINVPYYEQCGQNPFNGLSPLDCRQPTPITTFVDALPYNFQSYKQIPMMNFADVMSSTHQSSLTDEENRIYTSPPIPTNFTACNPAGTYFDVTTSNSGAYKPHPSVQPGFTLPAPRPLMDVPTNQRKRAEMASKKEYIKWGSRIECKFCKKNGELHQVYSTHRVKGPTGKVKCPVLHSYRCDLCGATGDVAHTKTYCPKYAIYSSCEKFV